MKKLIKPFLIILVCTITVFIFSMIYGFFQGVPSDVVILEKDVFNYRIQSGFILFCKLLFATFATGSAVGFSWAFATEADPKKHRTSTFMLPQLKNVLIVITTCTLLFIVAADYVQPVSEMKQNTMIQDAANFQEYTDIAKDHAARGEYVTAQFYAAAAYALNPDDAEAKRFANEMETAVVSMDDYAEAKAEEQSEEEKLTSALDFLTMAQKAWDDGDFWNAHYYATCAEEMSPRDDETLKVARELASASWSKLGTFTEGVNADTEEIYYAKKFAYSYLENGDTLQAYYAFKKLRDKYPKDQDIEKYFEDAEARLENSYFYTDETDDIRSLEKFNNVWFTLPAADGGSDIFEIKGITVVGNAGQLVQYLRDTRITTTDARGNVVSILNIPYAKMSAQNKLVALTREEDKNRKVEYVPFLLLESVNKNADVERLHIKPSWETADTVKEVPSAMVLDMPYDDFTLIRQASTGPELMPLVSLFKFVSIADDYGFSSASFRTTLILRLTLPLFVLALLMYMAVIGWCLRLEPGQPFKTRWLLMFPLFAFVTYIAKDLLLYILRLIAYALCDVVPVMALPLIVLTALVAVLLTSIYFLNQRSE